eukprot:3300282-Amphidinium_carterae.1
MEYGAIVEQLEQLSQAEVASRAKGPPAPDAMTATQFEELRAMSMFTKQSTINLSDVGKHIVRCRD